MGQTRLLSAREPIATVLANPSLDEEVRQRLELVQEARAFARELGLDVGGQYTSFVDWPGDRVVTTVVATRPGEVTPAGFYFPFVGRLPYKGFFDRARADAEAGRLRAEGLDVCEVGVRAYSTLGWLDDPVTGPMLRRDPGRLVETILHELVHVTVYVRDHIDFNEGVAAFIGEEGSVLFYAREGRVAEAAARRRSVERGRAIDALLVALREEIAALYATSEEGPARSRAREELETRTRSQLAELPELGEQRAAEVPLNDACLALIGTYSADVDGYQARLEGLGGDLSAFIAAVVAAADADDPNAALLLR